MKWRLIKVKGFAQNYTPGECHDSMDYQIPNVEQHFFRKHFVFCHNQVCSNIITGGLRVDVKDL